MNQPRGRFPIFFACMMLLCCVLLMISAPLLSSLRFQREDLKLSLETSHGRERKQRSEYDEVVQDLPRTQEELSELQPQADAAVQAVAELKARRKELRARLKDLQDLLAQSTGEENPHE